MTDRRVKVTVDADYDPLIKGSDEAAAAVKAAHEEVKSLDKQVEETGRDMDKLAAETALAKKEVSDLGSKSRGTKHDLEQLDGRIAASRKSMQELGLEFARTGEKIDSTAFSREKSLLARLERLRKELTAGGDSSGNGRGVLADVAGVAAEAATEAAKIGEQAGSAFMSSISDAVGGKGKAILIGALVEAAAIASIPVGAAIAGGITAAMGTVGIAGGIFAASKDPVVRSAATQFGQDISRMFFGSGSEFVEPIRRSLALLDKDFADLDLGHAFAPLAADTEQLANGVGRFAKNVMPGLTRAFEKSGPFIHALSDGLGETGSALGQFTDDISRNHGAVEGLRELFAGIDLTVRVLGKTLETLAAANHIVVQGFALTAHVAADLAGAVGLNNDKMEIYADKASAFASDAGSGTIPAVKGLGDAWAGSAFRAEAYAQAVKEADQAQTDYITHAVAAKDATLGVAQGWLDLNENIKRGKKNWSDNTQAGIDNQQMLVRQIDALQRQRQAAIDAGDGSAASVLNADRAYNEQLAVLEQLAIKAGEAKDAFEAMAKTYNIRVDINVHTAGVKSAAVDQNLKIHGFATGGDPAPGELAWVGEHGKELVRFGSGAHVYNHNESMVITKQWNGGGSGSSSGPSEMTLRVIHQTPDGRVLRTELIRDATGRGVPSVTTAGAYP